MALREAFGVTGVVQREGAYGEKENSLGWPSSLCIPHSLFSHGGHGCSDGSGLAERVARAGQEVVALGDAEWHIPGPLLSSGRWDGVGMLWGRTPHVRAPGRMGEVGEGVPRVPQRGDRVPAEGMGNEDKVPPALRTENKYQG